MMTFLAPSLAALLGATLGSILTLAVSAKREQKAKLRALIEELAHSRKQIEALAGLHLEAYLDHVAALLRCVVTAGCQAVVPHKELAVTFAVIHEQYRLMLVQSLCDSYSLALRALVLLPKQRRSLMAQVEKLDLQALALPSGAGIQTPIASPADGQMELDRLQAQRNSLREEYSTGVEKTVLRPLTEIRLVVEEIVERKFKFVRWTDRGKIGGNHA